MYVADQLANGHVHCLGLTSHACIGDEEDMLHGEVAKGWRMQSFALVVLFLQVRLEYALRRPPLSKSYLFL